MKRSKKGDKLFTLYSSKEINSDLKDELSKAYRIGAVQVENKIIIDRLK